MYTLVPYTYQGVCRMYLRWERGNVRESLVQLGYLFTRHRKKYRLLPIVEFFLAQLEYPLTLLLGGLLLASVAVYPRDLINSGCLGDDSRLTWSITSGRSGTWSSSTELFIAIMPSSCSSGFTLTPASRCATATG